MTQLADAQQAPGDTPESVRLAVIRAFAEAPVCYLATCCGQEPNVVPVGFKWIEAGRLLIADLFFSKTRANLQISPRVAVSVGLLNPKRGFQVKGSAKVHRDGAVFEHVCELLRCCGVAAKPAAALEIELDEVYALDPGPAAGMRVTVGSLK
jgi:predicted pyridoxine 5'-phosphate oxidase superfamily flavin-nucleotide-binding protein